MGNGNEGQQQFPSSTRPRNPNLNPGQIDRTDLDNKAVEGLEALEAKRKIELAWQREGGPRSDVGLPVGETIELRRDGDAWLADFRSGTISFRNNDNFCIVSQKRLLHVNFVGLECVSRQEASDEIYGVVGLIGPANAKSIAYPFPGGDSTVSMGKSGERLWTSHIEMYADSLQDIIVVASLIEHDDFADVQAAADRIAEQIEEKGRAVIGSLTGLPAEAAAEETWFKDGLASGLGLVMDDILGMGDDPYPAQVLRIPMEEIGEMGPSLQPPRKRSDDPKSIPAWTHKIVLSARDNGGDYGEYAAYFHVFVEDHTIARPCPVT